MNKNIILKADILDIIFEKRNKVYGAYDLRKFYPNRLKRALGFMLFIALAFSVLTLVSPQKKGVISKPYDIPVTELKKVQDISKEAAKKPEVAKPETKTSATAANQKKFVKNILIVPVTVKTESIITLLPTDVIGTENIEIPDPGTARVQPDKPAAGIGNPGKTTPNMDITSAVELHAVDIPPAYPGGNDALHKFLQRNLHNPKDMEECESVSVRIRFVVNYNGKLQGFVTEQDGGEEFNNEVVRVLKKMPEWIPGKAKGQNVSVYYTFPVKFVSAY